MHEFTPDEARRWNAWQQANAVSARRGGRLAGLFGLAMLTAMFAAVALALWR
jgi:hypothetical protein